VLSTRCCDTAHADLDTFVGLLKDVEEADVPFDVDVGVVAEVAEV
jgi:hypothetical protein